MRGRKPKPTALKVLHGNPGKRALPANEPAPDLLSVEEDPPPMLSDEARQYWPEIARELAKTGVLTTMDHASLLLLVEAMADYVVAREAVREFGDTIQTGLGYEQVSPWMRQKWKAREHLLKLLVEFGMTPSSRARVRVTNPPKKRSRFEAMRTGATILNPDEDGGSDDE